MCHHTSLSSHSGSTTGQQLINSLRKPSTYLRRYFSFGVMSRSPVAPSHQFVATVMLYILLILWQRDFDFTITSKCPYVPYEQFITFMFKSFFNSLTKTSLPENNAVVISSSSLVPSHQFIVTLMFNRLSILWQRPSTYLYLDFLIAVMSRSPLLPYH